jgi:hypothetical protein
VLSPVENDLLFSANRLGQLHAKWKEYSGDNHDKGLNDIEVLHVDIVAQHVEIAGDVGRLITPSKLGSDNQEDRPAT